MLSFINWLNERTVDPVELANRVARRYGKRTNYGKHLKATKGQNIPLSSYNRKNVTSLENKYDRFLNKTGHFNKDTQKQAIEHRKTLTKTESLPIKSLHATQPFNRTEDQDTLRMKVDNQSPDHIHVITHKGVHYVADGHHAVMAAHLRGDTHVTVNHFDLDKHG